MIYIAFGEEGRKDIQKPWIIQMRRRERIPLRLRRRFCRDKTPLVFASAFIVSFVLMPPSLSSSISYHPCLSAFLAAKSISLHMVYSIHLSPRIRVPAWKEIKGRTYALNSILCLLIHFTPSSPGVSIKSRSIHCGRCRGCKKREKFCSEDWGWDLFSANPHRFDEAERGSSRLTSSINYLDLRLLLNRRESFFFEKPAYSTYVQTRKLFSNCLIIYVPIQSRHD